MHTYEKLDLLFEEWPAIGTTPFRCVDDVVRYAAIDKTIGWKTWPEVWHLDDRGLMVCGYSASSLCSVVGWARDPYPLVRSRLEGERAGGCGSTWLVIDSRPGGTWTICSAEPPTEADAAAFLEVRGVLQPLGVDLVDVMVFDDDAHYLVDARAHSRLDQLVSRAPQPGRKRPNRAEIAIESPPRCDRDRTSS